MAEEAIWRVRRVAELQLEEVLNQLEAEGFQVVHLFPVTSSTGEEQFTVAARQMVVKAKRGMGF